ncbi:hypothetical protein D3C71_175270 [compost metagenome]
MNDTVSSESAPASHGCHVDLAPGEQPDGCVLDYGTPHDCAFGVFPSGRLRRSRNTCPHWRKIDGRKSQNR